MAHPIEPRTTVPRLEALTIKNYRGLYNLKFSKRDYSHV